MPRAHIDTAVIRGDRAVLRAFPRLAQAIEAKGDDIERAEMDAWLKLLPGAIERFQATTSQIETIPESVQGSINQLVASFTFGARNTASVEAETVSVLSNTAETSAETEESVGASDQPEGCGTGQLEASSALSRNELVAPAGSGREADSLQAGQRNPRVGTRSKLSGRAAARRARQASDETASDRG